MAGKLIELVTGSLMEKFGAGSHKPGSGSASALQGMISAKLLITVIDLTKRPKKSEKYKDKLKDLLKIREEIETRIYPSLETLFQEDSDHFDKVIRLINERNAVDQNHNPVLWREKVDAYNEALRIATDLPIKIAQDCYDLGRHSGDVFDFGFKPARGDSGVALQGAIAGMASCLSIIELNLSNLPADSWMEKIRKQKAILKTQYLELLTLGSAKLGVLEKEAEESWQSEQIFAMYRNGTLGQTIRTDQDMEKLVRDFQNKLWLQRDKIWKKGTIDNAMKVINPKDVIQNVLGFAFTQSDSLGMHTIGNEVFEIAGLIDKNRKLVSVSSQFHEEIMNFTAAHELGHLLLHEQAVLHRDRPVDGSSSAPKDSIEQQADKFAAYFLMPAAVVRDAFYEIFGTERLKLNESVVLALAAGNLGDFRSKCKDLRGFASAIAQAELFSGKSFNSLSKIFKVSAGAMAIRLMELSLVEF